MRKKEKEHEILWGWRWGSSGRSWGEEERMWSKYLRKYFKIKILKAMIYNLKTLMGIVDNIEDEIHNVSSEKNS